MKYFVERPFIEAQLAALIEASPAAFRLEIRFSDPGFYILNVDSGEL